MTEERHSTAMRASFARNLKRRCRRLALGAVLVISAAALGAAFLPSPTDLQSQIVQIPPHSSGAANSRIVSRS